MNINTLDMSRVNHKHGDCIHYNNGLCTYHNASVNPDGPACPMYSPRTNLVNNQDKQYPSVKSVTHNPSYPINTRMRGRGRGRRRRGR